MERPLRVALCYCCEGRDAHDVYHRVAPTGLFNIHGVLRAHGFDSRLFNFSGRRAREVRRALADFRPELAGVSHFTYNHAAAVGLYATLRQAAPRCLVVAGGAQAAFLDAEILSGGQRPDLVVRGEGEAVLLAVARRAAQGARDWRAIPGLSWRDQRGVHRTPDASLALDLDPLYTDERFEALDGVHPAEQFGFIITSRGCAASCTFCSSPCFWRRRVRRRSPARVVDEIALLRRRFGLPYFGVRDDTFTANKASVRAFCEELSRRRLRVKWNCQSRVNLVDEERLRWMKQAGCEQMQFGVESASPAVLRRLNKQIRAEQIESALEACRRAGIRSGAYFITGAPGQTDSDIAANQRLFDECGLEDGVVTPLVYYPGTALFDEAFRRGEVGVEIFFADDPERLVVRRDGAARRQYETMVQMIEAARRRARRRRPR